MTTSSTLADIAPDTYALQVAEVLKRAEAQRLVRRLWEKDASLWTSNPPDQQSIKNRLGWLSIVAVMEAQVATVQEAAEEIRRDGFTHAVLLGMGGSSLFPDVCRSVFGVTAGWLDLTMLDTTDPTAIDRLRACVPLARTIIIVSSKSGSTLETSSLCSYFYEQVRAIRKGEAGRQFVAITDVGTAMEAQARSLGFRRAFVHGPTMGQDVGGRFSALTYFGLVPAALMGVEIRKLLARARAMLDACGPTVPLAENPAAQLGGFLGVGAAQGKDKVTLLCPPSLASLGTWIEQLVAESTGKSGRGLVPIHEEPLREPSAYQADRLFIELQMAGQPDRTLERAVSALAEAGHPVIRLRRADPYDLGGETIRWFLATAVASTMMRINPFDEPNVQESKDRTRALLDRYARDGRLPEEAPALTDGGIAVYWDLMQVDGCSLEAVLRAFLQGVGATDYLAVLSFLPRTAELDAAVVEVRAQLARGLPCATMLGFGPRYLHSIGQLHKGGPARAALLFLTGDDPVDVPVPGQPYTFSVLKRAQALGDVQALTDRKRRVLRLHLSADARGALVRLRGLLGTILSSRG